MNANRLAIEILLLCISCGASALAAFNPSLSSSAPARNFSDTASAPPKYLTEAANLAKTRRKRYISQNDMVAILDYHNKVRGKVFPPASNMEYMVSLYLLNFQNIWILNFCFSVHRVQ